MNWKKAMKQCRIVFNPVQPVEGWKTLRRAMVVQTLILSKCGMKQLLLSMTSVCYQNKLVWTWWVFLPFPSLLKPWGSCLLGKVYEKYKNLYKFRASIRYWINAHQRVQPKSNYYAIFVMSLPQTKSGNSPKMEKLLSLFPNIQEKY